MSRFWGTTYHYQTPLGPRPIGVRIGLGLLYIVCYVKANGSLRRVKAPELTPASDPAALQARLDKWALTRDLEICLENHHA
jgi:hypothetical protein